MENLLDSLRAWGCDVDSAMERFIEDEELYINCLELVTQDKNFKQLETALKEGETEQAFDYAHTLKGVIANVGLTPMFDILVRIIEPLRAGRMDELLSIYEELEKANQYVEELLRDYYKEA